MAATSISACRVKLGMWLVPVCTTVTVALAPVFFCTENGRQRLAHQVAAPADDHVLAGRIVAAPHQHLLYAVGRAGQEAGLAP